MAATLRSYLCMRNQQRCVTRVLAFHVQRYSLRSLGPLRGKGLSHPNTALPLAVASCFTAPSHLLGLLASGCQGASDTSSISAPCFSIGFDYYLCLRRLLPCRTYARSSESTRIDSLLNPDSIVAPTSNKKNRMINHT